MFMLIVLLLIDGVECTRGEEGVITSFNMFLLGMFLAGGIVGALSKEFRSYVEEHFWILVAANIAVNLFCEKSHVALEGFGYIKTVARRVVSNVSVRLQ